MTDIFTLGIKADTTDIDRGTDRLDKFSSSAGKADKKTGDLRKGVNTAGKAVLAFGAIAAVALGGITVAAANTAREIETLSRLSNLNSEEFQRAAFAAKSYGIEQDKLADIFKDTQDKVGDFLTTGAGPMVDFFEKIAPKVGVTADQFRNLNGKDALQLYTSSLEKANLSQAEMVFFLEAIASDATLLQPLLADNGAEFERLSERADKLGIVLSNIDITNLNTMKVALDELAMQSKATSDIIGATLAPFVTNLTEKFIDNAVGAETVREAMTTIVEVGVRIGGVFADAGRVFEIFGKALGATAFSVVERFNVLEERLMGFGIAFTLTFKELQLALIEWVNEQEDEMARWATTLLNMGDVFDLIEDMVIEPMPLDTKALEESISTLKTEASDIEVVLAQSSENISNAWQDVLDLMAEPLPSDTMDKWVQNIIKGVDAQKELQEEIKKTGETNTKIVAVVGSDAVIWANTTKEVTSGLDLAFGENEKAAKALHKVNQVIAIAEHAMTLQKVFSDAALTTSHVANSTVRATANATEAVTSAAAAPFPMGFAAAAAMIGLMASVLGGFSGGGSSGTGTGSEGTELGGGVSESLTKSNEKLENIMIAQLAELRGLRGDLSNVENLSSGLFRELLSVDVGHSEIKNATERALEDSLRGLNEGVASGSFTDSLRDIFDGVGSAIGEAMGVLGMDTTDALSDFVFTVGTISFDDLSAEEAEKRLNEVLSAQSDLLVESVAPFITQYQQIGEGALETLVRVAQEQAVFNDALSQMGTEMADLSTVMQIDIAQGVIALIGGAERFNELTGTFFSEFYTEAEQFEQLSSSLTEAVEGLGLTMFESRDDFRAMVEGVDLTTEAGQSLFASLLELTPAMDDFFDTLENNAAEEAAEAESVLEDARRAEEKAASDLAREISNLTNELENAAKASLKGLTDSVAATQAELKTKLDEELASIGMTFDQRRSDVQSRVDAQVTSMNNQLDFVNNQVSELAGLSGLLAGSLNSLVSISRESARGNIQGAIAAARSGQSLVGSDLSGSISALANIDAGSFGSQIELQKERARSANDLQDLKDLTDGQLSAAEQTVKLLEQQITTIQASGERQIENLNIEQEKAEEAARANFEEEFDKLQSIIDLAQAELDAVLGIENGILSILESQSIFTQAIIDLVAQQAVQAANEQATLQETAIQSINTDIEKLVDIQTTKLPVVEAVDNSRPYVVEDATGFSMADTLKTIAINSAKQAKILKSWDGDGQPEVRNVS